MYGLAWLELASLLSSVEKYLSVCVCVCCVCVCKIYKYIYKYIVVLDLSLTNYLMAWQIIAIFVFFSTICLRHTFLMSFRYLDIETYFIENRIFVRCSNMMNENYGLWLWWWARQRLVDMRSCVFLKYTFYTHSILFACLFVYFISIKYFDDIKFYNGPTVSISHEYRSLN